MTAAGLDYKLDEFALHLPAPPDLGDGLELPVRGEGKERLDLENRPRHGSDLPNAAAPLKILQGIHGKEGKGVLDQMGNALLDKLLPGSARPQVFCQLQQHCAHAKRTAHRVKDLDFQVMPLFCHKADHIICAGEAAGQENGDNAIIAVCRDLVKGGGDVLAGGQRGLGQLAGAEQAVDISGADIYAVPKLTVPAADAQRDRVDVVFFSKLAAQVRTGIGEKRNLSRGHSDIISIG